MVYPAAPSPVHPYTRCAVAPRGPSGYGPEANLQNLVCFALTYYTTLFAYLAPIQALRLSRLSLFCLLDPPVSHSYLSPYAALSFLIRLILIAHRSESSLPIWN